MNLIETYPFATLPLTFVLTNRAVVGAETMDEVREQVNALVTEARRRGLTVTQYDDPETRSQVFRVSEK